MFRTDLILLAVAATLAQFHIPLVCPLDAAASETYSGEHRVACEGRPLLISVTVGGRDVPFLVDTGAAKSAFDVTLKDHLGPAQGHIVLKTSAGTMQTELFTCPSASIGSHDLSRVGTVLCLDLTPIRCASGEDVRGILGMDFLRHFVVEIDFDRGLLRLATTAPEKWHATSQQLPLSWRGGCPAVSMALPGNRTELFIVDTGANSSQIRGGTFDELVNEGHLVPGASQRSFTVAGEVEDETGYVNRLSLGPFTHSHVRLNRDPMSAVGLRYLSRYAMLFDFPGNSVRLSESRQFSIPDPVATSGMAILQIDGQKIVYAIEDNGPAAMAGLRVGDVIHTVDGEPASKSDIFELSRTFTSEPGRTIEILAHRGSSVLDLQVVLQHR